MKKIIVWGVMFSVFVVRCSEQQMAVMAATVAGRSGSSVVDQQPGMKLFDVAALQQELDQKPPTFWERVNKARGLNGTKVRGNYHHKESCVKEGCAECRQYLRFVGDCTKQACCDGVASCCCPVIFCGAQLLTCYCKRYVIPDE